MNSATQFKKTTNNRGIEVHHMLVGERSMELFSDYGILKVKPTSYTTGILILDIIRTTKLSNKKITDIPDIINEENHISRTKNNGKIYLISDGTYTKIGMTSKPNSKTRMNSMQSGNANKLTIIHEYETSDRQKEEARLHYKYRAKRKQGEWFNLSSHDISSIKKQDEIYYVGDKENKDIRDNDRFKIREYALSHAKKEQPHIEELIELLMYDILGHIDNISDTIDDYGIYFTIRKHINEFMETDKRVGKLIHYLDKRTELNDYINDEEIIRAEFECEEA